MDRLGVIAGHVAASAASSLGDSSSVGVEGVAGATSVAPLLEGQVAIVTGAGQGIGAATARLFGAHGARVVVSDLDGAKAEAVAAEIRSNGGAAISFAGDVTDPTFADRVVQATIDAYGKLNILVNNAGFTWDGMLHKMTDQQWHVMLEVHNTAPFRLIRAAAPYMREAAKREIDEGKTPENRSIINISSTSGIHGNLGQANYATAKMGIIGLTKTVAKEWGMFGIRCNAIAFGLINTRLTQAKEKGDFIQVEGQKIALGIPGKMTAAASGFEGIPLRRQGEPHEAAGAMLFLASSLSSYVSGHTLEVTGGAGI